MSSIPRPPDESEMCHTNRILKGGAFADTIVQLNKVNLQGTMGIGIVSKQNFSNMGCFNVGLMIQALKQIQSLGGHVVRFTVGNPDTDASGLSHCGPILMGVGTSSVCVVVGGCEDFTSEDFSRSSEVNRTPTGTAARGGAE